MEPIELVAEVLKYTLPAVLVLMGIYLVLDAFRKKEERKERVEVRAQTLGKIIPLRLQAYERVVIFLERMNPESLLLRCDGRGKPARVFHAQLQGEIRAEFEHNLAQQIYISLDAWGAVLKAKDQTIALINQSMRQMKENSSGIDLGKQILANMEEVKMYPSLEAIQVLKTDIHKSFRLIG
ncbi:MAG: hypothetical protein H6581_14500 [Bacteroidia bacterium]|nr:hypothetical protein [Bacteroidia bacterium]